MDNNRIIAILKNHGVLFHIDNGRINVLESHDLQGNDYYADVTGYTKRQLYEFLGYEFINFFS